VTDDGADEEWARWEQTFRDARPVLPEAAMSRIESAIRRENDRADLRRPGGGPRRVWLWIAVAIASIVAVGAPLMYWRPLARLAPVGNFPESTMGVRDQYPLDLPIEPLPTTRPDTGPRALTQIVVEARSKSVQEGVATYVGPVKISAGPWRIACDRLTVFRGAGHGALLSGAGAVHVRGVSGISGADADEMTLDSENGDLKLTGHVKLQGPLETRHVQSCTINRAGSVHDAQP
ncbi:MAG TPA: LptA/OstA family protein, partial [Tepidisphaeraceae bacterium]|nr:LptA/OstA family protein [Tepidisphaeraceae bacterium]